MSGSIFDEVKKTAAILGGCDPLWLKEEKEPEFVAHRTGNQGPELLLLHGLFGALSNWNSVIPHFAKFCQPIALEFPITAGHRSAVKVKALAAFTEYFIRKEKLQPVAICGNSMGGHVAMRLCLAAPQLVDCLILSGSSGLYEHTVDTLPVRPGREFVRDHMGRVFFNSQFVTEEAINEITDILKSRVRQLNLIHAARSAKKDNLQELLKDIKVPTLLLWGEDDRVTTMDVAEQFHRRIPNSTLVTVKNCGHAPMIEHPEWFSEQVEKFLARNSRSSAPTKVTPIL